jgi:hypothetical protein
MLEIGLPLTINEIGATPDMIPGITEGTICYPAGYMDLKPEDITEILKESLSSVPVSASVRLTNNRKKEIKTNDV